MKFAKVFFLLVLSANAVSACSSGDEAAKRKSGGALTGTGTTNDGTTPNQTGVLLIDLSSSSATGTVGQQVQLTAQGWLDTAKTTPVTAGTNISFSRTNPSGILSDGSVAADATGKASVNITASAAGAVTVEASIGTVRSAALSIPFQAAGSGGGGGGGGAAPSVVSDIQIQTNKTAVNVNDDSSGNTSDQATVTATVLDQDGVVMSGVKVKLSSTAGALSSTVLTSNSSGIITATFTAGIVAEDVDITASADGKLGTTTLTVGPGAPVVIEVGDPTPAQLGVRGSGSPETSIVVFTIKDKYGNLVSDNTAVSFTLVPALGGATVSPSSTTTHDGVISPVVSSGTKSGTLRLVATVPSVGRSVTSGKIAIFGGPPSADRFRIVVESGKVVLPGFGRYGDIARMTVYMADTYGNPPQAGTAVYTACEAGRCGTNSSDGLSSDEAGHAMFNFETAFDDLVLQDPSWVGSQQDFGGYVGLDHTWPALGDPRNGKVTVLALATGQSGYNDLNGNNVFDAGFDTVTDDPSEPFVDRDSDATYDASVEDFWDFDGDGIFDSHLVDTYHSQQYIWDSIELIYSASPNLQMVPQQYIDVNGDGIYTVNSDLIAVGSPMPADQAALLAAFPQLTAAAQLRPDYANFNTSSTVVTVSFSDNNKNPLPADSTLEASMGSDGVSIESPPASALKYTGNEFVAKAMVDFVLVDATPAAADKKLIRFCAEIDNTYNNCINGVQF